MPRPLRLPIPTRGEIDTAMPVSDRDLGVLVSAYDLSPRFWGPKRGSGRFTGVWEGPGTASLYDSITLNGSGSASARAISYEDAFRDLGTTFTVDLWFQLQDIAYASAVNRIGLYEFAPNSGIVGVSIFGGAHTDHERIEVTITTSPTRTTTASAVTFTGATRIAYGTTQTDKHHVRIVRDGANAYLYLDGVLDGSTSGLSAVNPINGAYGSTATVLLGSSSSSNITFKGVIYGAVLRDGVFTTQPIESVMLYSPFAKNTHHYHLGRNHALGGDDHYFDAGRFSVHARLHGTSGVHYTIGSGVDNTAPAPAPVQGIRTWTTRSGRTASSVMAGGILSTLGVS